MTERDATLDWYCRTYNSADPAANRGARVSTELFGVPAGAPPPHRDAVRIGPQADDAVVAALSVTAAELVYHLAAAFRQSPAAGARANMALVDAIEQVVRALHQKPTAEDIDTHLRRYLGILGSLVVNATDGARRLVEAEERVARGEEP